MSHIKEALARIGGIDLEHVMFYLDMDGVFADFNKTMDRALKTVLGIDWTYRQDRYLSDPEYKKQMWQALEDYQTKFDGEIWYDLEPMDDAYELWNFVSQYPVEILSAVKHKKYGAEEQKRRWWAEHFDPDTIMNFVSEADDKAQFAGPNSILIDDRPRAIIPWTKADGVGIVHINAKTTIQHLKDMGL